MLRTVLFKRKLSFLKRSKRTCRIQYYSGWLFDPSEAQLRQTYLHNVRGCIVVLDWSVAWRGFRWGGEILNLIRRRTRRRRRRWRQVVERWWRKFHIFLEAVHTREVYREKSIICDKIIGICIGFVSYCTETVLVCYVDIHLYIYWKKAYIQMVGNT